MASEVHEHLVSGIVHAAKSRDPSTSHEAVNVVWQDMQSITLDEAADYWTYCLDVDPKSTAYQNPATVQDLMPPPHGTIIEAMNFTGQYWPCFKADPAKFKDGYLCANNQCVRKHFSAAFLDARLAKPVSKSSLYCMLSLLSLVMTLSVSASSKRNS